MTVHLCDDVYVSMNDVDVPMDKVDAPMDNVDAPMDSKNVIKGHEASHLYMNEREN